MASSPGALAVLPFDATIRGGVGAEDEQLTLALDFAGDFHRLGDEVQDVFVHGLAITGDEEEIERGAVGPTDQEHRRDAAADAANGAGAVRRERAWIHHAEVT